MSLVIIFLCDLRQRCLIGNLHCLITDLRCHHPFFLFHVASSCIIDFCSSYSVTVNFIHLYVYTTVFLPVCVFLLPDMQKTIIYMDCHVHVNSQVI